MLHNHRKHSLKGKTYEEIYGPEKAQQMREVRSGTNHWLWKGGARSHWRGEDWSQARKATLERDNYTCQDCGKVKKLMDVHHLVPWHETHDNSLENLISLCRSCHIKREKPYLTVGPISEDTKRKYSERSIRFWSNPENKLKASKRMIGNKFSPKVHNRDSLGKFKGNDSVT